MRVDTAPESEDIACESRRRGVVLASCTLKAATADELKYFEVHFYRNGHIEVAVTEDAPEPSLRLERDSRGPRYIDEAMKR